MPKIQLRRGEEAKLPTLSEGEPGFTTDSGKLFVGHSSGNVEYARKSDVNDLEGQIDSTTNEVTSSRGSFNSVPDRLSNIESYLTAVNAKTNGAKGDGVTDDTAALQAIFNNFNVIRLPAGTYMIDAITKLNVPANKTIFFDKGAVLQAITNSATSYTILNINSDNVTLWNPVVIGDRTTHTGTTGEWGHGIVVTNNAKNVKIYNPNCSNCWGDGFVVYGAENLYVENLISDNNRRQGVSITRIKNSVFLNPICKNTNGTSPQAGIDIEPNNTADYIDGLTIFNPRTENNSGAGIVVALRTLDGSNQNVNIVIDHHTDIGSLNGLAIASLPGNANYFLDGKVVVNKPKYYSNQQNGIDMRDYSSLNTPIIEIVNPIIYNPNNSSQASPLYGSGISFYRIPGDSGVNNLGNVYIEKPVIIDERATPKMVRGIYCVNTKDSVGFSNCLIENPKTIKGVTANNMIDIRAGVTVRDTFNVTKLLSTTGTSIYNTVQSIVTNDGATALIIFTLNQSNVFDSEITFVNNTAYGIQVTPQSTQSFLPLSATAGKYIQTTQKGASITLKRIDTNTYRVVNMVGTWTAQP